MAESRLALSEFRGVWLFAMFDLPVETAKERRDYTRFRKHLLSEGFMMLQYSVYGRYCTGEEVGEAFRRRIRLALPPGGQVRLLHVTDHQFGKMEVYDRGKKRKPESAPAQLALF